MTQKRRLGLAVPNVLYSMIAERAKYQGKTINAVCLEIFWWYFDRRENTPPGQKEA